MKIYMVGLALALSALAAVAQDNSHDVKRDFPSATAETVAQTEAINSSAAGNVATEKNALKLEFLAKTKSQPALFRPSQNMPEIINVDLVRGMAESGKAKSGKKSQLIGYMPKLKVLPCTKGCEGKDYDRAVTELLKGYRGDDKLFEERGEMIVQVRWFHVRPFLMRQLPYSSDLFGVSFMLEGKVVSLGKKSGVGKSIDAHELAYDLGARLATELAFTLGMGVKPSFLQPGIRSGEGFAGGVLATTKAVDGMMGVEDVNSRIEPATEAHRNLLPAIDGILPNEIEPITEMRYLNLMLL